MRRRLAHGQRLRRVELEQIVLAYPALELGNLLPHGRDELSRGTCCSDSRAMTRPILSSSSSGAAEFGKYFGHSEIGEQRHALE